MIWLLRLLVVLDVVVLLFGLFAFSCLFGYFASWVCVSTVGHFVAFAVVGDCGIAWFILALRLRDCLRF